MIFRGGGGGVWIFSGNTQSLKVRASRKSGACSPGKILRYVTPLRYHFLHFETTVNENTKATIIAGSRLDAKTVKMVENPQKNGKEAC